MIGYYIQPAGDPSMEIKMPYYNIRVNKELGFMSSKPLGLQILVDSIGGKHWINVINHWLCDNPNHR